MSVFFSCVSLSAVAAPVQWAVNGHWYDLVPKSNLVNTWGFARDHAATQTFVDPVTGETLIGHLTTITSAGENDFVINQFGSEGWIGAYQDITAPGVDIGSNGVADTDEGWHWVTGETWDYTNWSALEPNDQGPSSGDPLNVENGGEDVLMLWSTGYWNDFSQSAFSTRYYIEYESVSAVPIPAAVWLFGSGLIGLIGVARRKKA